MIRRHPCFERHVGGHRPGLLVGSTHLVDHEVIDLSIPFDLLFRILLVIQTTSCGQNRFHGTATLDLCATRRPPDAELVKATEVAPGHQRTPAYSWLRLDEAAERARVSTATLRREIRAGRLRHARVSGRKTIRLRPEWVDAWLEASATPLEVNR